MNWQEFNWLDIVLLVVTLAAVASSVRNGFTREIVGLVSVAVALVGGIWFYGTAGGLLEPYLSSRGLANFCGFLIVFFGVLMAGSLVGFLLGKVLKLAGLSFMDRLLGAAFGFIKGVLVSIALIMAIVAFAPAPKGTAPAAVVRSQLAPYVIEASNWLTAMAPRELKDAFASRYQQIKKIWRDTVRELPRATI